MPGEGGEHMFRVIVAGSRDFQNYLICDGYITHMLSEKLSRGEEIVILSGHCRGADALGEHYARLHGLRLEIFEADFARYGPAAGPRRNRRMAGSADALIAFWDGKSAGTRNMIETARRCDLHIRVLRYKEQGARYLEGM